MENLDEYFNEIKSEFPIFNTKIDGSKLVYLDSAATGQKPNDVINALVNYYDNFNSNVHRGEHTLSQKSTDMFEHARERVANFINSSCENIVFTTGATHAITQVAFGLENYFEEGDEIVITEMEHHANIVTWKEIAKKNNLTLKFIPFKENFLLDYDEAQKIITSKTKLVAFSQMSNVLGTMNDSKKLISMAKKVGALTLIDGCQGIVHQGFDVKEFDCDFYVFSAHKLYGPTGVGVLYAKDFSLLRPLIFGGGQIEKVDLVEDVIYSKPPYKFEAGTPNIADIIAFTKSFDFLDKVGIDKIRLYEEELGKYFLNKVSVLGNDFILYGPKTMENRGNVFSFSYAGIHSSDLCAFLDQFGIALRGGHHCAQPLHKKLGISGTARASLVFYNTKSDIDYLIESLKKIKEMI